MSHIPVWIASQDVLNVLQRLGDLIAFVLDWGSCAGAVLFAGVLGDRGEIVGVERGEVVDSAGVIGGVVAVGAAEIPVAVADVTDDEPDEFDVLCAGMLGSPGVFEGGGRAVAAGVRVVGGEVVEVELVNAGDREDDGFGFAVGVVVGDGAGCGVAGGVAVLVVGLILAAEVGGAVGFESAGGGEEFGGELAGAYLSCVVAAEDHDALLDVSSSPAPSATAKFCIRMSPVASVWSISARSCSTTWNLMSDSALTAHTPMSSWLPSRDRRSTLTAEMCLQNR